MPGRCKKPSLKMVYPERKSPLHKGRRYLLKMGSVLLMDALHRALESSRQVASTAVIVDAIDDTAVEFYKRFDFEPFLNNALRLYKPMIDISKQFDSSAIAP